MSLIHRHPGTLDPRVHYRSPFFDADAAAREARKALSAAQAKADAEMRREFSTLLGLSAQQTAMLFALVQAGAEGVATAELIAAGLVLTNTSGFLNRFRARMADLDLPVSQRRGGGRNGRTIIHYLAPDALANLARELEQRRVAKQHGAVPMRPVPAPRPAPARRRTVQRSAEMPVATPPSAAPSAPAVLVMLAFDLTEKQAALLLALHRAGAGGLRAAAIRAAMQVDNAAYTVERLALRLVKHGYGVERAEMRDSYRLPQALRMEIEHIIASAGDADA
ncbi:MAG: hypothetical protein LCH38_10925 [Proteobacteria bacterium]|nr:hypothetical protein [Pseudomonadota bacterium]